MNLSTKTLLATLLIGLSASASEPTGYYDNSKGLCGAELLASLQSVSAPVTSLAYNDLWAAFYDTDCDPVTDIIYDIYATTSYVYSVNQCGNYSGVGSCYNREHSFPNSWFGGDKNHPAYTDLYHLYPSDGYVNNQRANYAFGECANGKRLSNGDLVARGRLGTSTFEGFSGTVFEPDDDMKGDFARTYFYMAAAYNDEFEAWGQLGKCDMLDSSAWPGYNEWSVNLLLKWNDLDPVDDRELLRQEVVAGYQGNRNPFIDHPELASYIWGDKLTTAWTGQTTDAVLHSPVGGSVIDLGTTMPGFQRTLSLDLRGSGFTSDVTIWVTGDAEFIVSPDTRSADKVNAGTTISLAYSPSTVGSHNATLHISDGTSSWTSPLRGACVDHLPALAATDVTDSSFIARWSDISGSTTAVYYLTVMNEPGDPIDGYDNLPVEASAEKKVVTGLDPASVYSYYLTYNNLRSNTIEVTTAAVPVDIEVTTTHSLRFTAHPGEPSEVATILVETYNATGEATAEVTAPFELSTDMQTWTTAIILPFDSNVVYARLNGSEEGTHESTLTVTCDGTIHDTTTLYGTISTASLTTVSADDELRAWCASAGELTIAARGNVAVYAIDGTTYLRSHIDGTITLPLASGLYIVTILDDNSQPLRVAVR